ncbi:MAG TPA: cyclic nucleotide-binding domain-containing protein [Methylophilaceae bacterium]
MSLRKVFVTAGVYYVEIPEAGLYLLCGAPADSVKHLIKRGLINTTEKNGAVFENGPNAILLSDAAVQNGHLCNLAEFPVLQMLYRQGMLIPNHPNNTGRKPLLIGMPEQLGAQLRYIHRGNYGLISTEEMVKAGIDEAEAEELMRIKLKFAFGHIVPPDQFLDCLPLADEALELEGGVRIERLHHNLFKISHGGESVEVDLNLAMGEIYPCPYPLSNIDVYRHYFSVIHSGDGDGWDCNRPAMGSILTHQGRIYLIDAGPNIHQTLDALGIGKKEVVGIFQTHCHDDHFAGLTALLQSDQPLQFFATPLVRASVTKKLCSLLSISESEFANYFDIQDLVLDEWNDIMGLEVMPVNSPHPVETTNFQFRVLWAGGYRTYAHLADIASFSVIDAMVTTDNTVPGMSAERAAKVKADYLQVADVKKIDIGGGMIHGSAADFEGDASEKLLLAHTARALSDGERRIGSGAPFGSIEVLIPGQQSFLLRDANEFLRSYFPTVGSDRLNMLLNNRITTFNPETIITGAGKVPNEIYLILSGKVEMLMQAPGGSHFLFSGSLIAEAAAIHNLPSTETYRSLSFVQALRLPADLYRNFVQRFFSSADLLEIREVEERLRLTFLFSDAVTATTLFGLAKACRITRLKAGETFSQLPDHVHTIGRGSMTNQDDGITLKRDDFWGADSLFVSMSTTKELVETRHNFVALDECEIYSLPLKSVARIPVVRWKLFEAFRNSHFYAGPRYRASTRKSDDVTTA